MLEKDIENLIANYPEEFFPDKKLKLQGQQIRLGSYYADIIFKDDSDSLIVIEVKRGVLSRDAIGQILDYYGVLREENPLKNINLILAANVIPKERTIFMSEKLGIGFSEIAISKILEVAKKYSYEFLDSKNPSDIREFQKISKIMTERIISGKSNVWIFQANPKRYDILNALDDSNIGVNHWLINQHKNYISKGDLCLIWMSGKDGGIYAAGEIVSNPEYLIDSEAESKYWFSDEDKERKKLRVKFVYKNNFVNNPLYREEIKNVTGLKNLSIFRQPQGTNFLVTDNEWKIISEMIQKKSDS